MESTAPDRRRGKGRARLIRSALLEPTQRIAVLSLHTSPLGRMGAGSNGGMNVYVREVCRALARLGVATDVFTRVPAGGPAGADTVDDLRRVVHVPVGQAGLRRHELLGVAQGFAEACVPMLESARCNALYSHYWLSGVAAERLRDRLGLPWAHSAHTWAMVTNGRLAPGARPEPEQRMRTEEQIANDADVLIASTEMERSALLRAYKIDRKRVSVVAPGVDNRTFRPCQKEDALHALGRDGQRLFVVVGRLERRKGVDVAVRALAALAAEHPSVRLLVVGGDGGESGEAERLRRLTAALGLGSRVEQCPPVAHPQLAMYYAAAEACLIPSYTELFGLVGLEAQACGTPIVVSRTAGIANLLRDGHEALLVEPGDACAIAVAMRRLLVEPGLAARLGRRGACLAATFSWQRTAQRLLDAFRPLC